MRRILRRMLQRRATFDRSRVFRYMLHRRWRASGKHAVFVMLNPSRADAEREDPTLRRCMDFATRLDCASLEVVNLFALRSPYPQDLLRVPDPVGPGNDRATRRALARADVIVAAWGNGAPGVPLRRLQARRVARLRRWVGEREVLCLGHTASGAPRHPVRLRADTPFETWSKAIRSTPQ